MKLSTCIAPIVVGLGLVLSTLDPNATQPLFFFWCLAAVAAGALLRKPVEDAPPAEPRPATLHRWLLVAILLGAAILRFSYIDFGFPYFNHPDEGPKGRIVSRMVQSGSLNPHYFLHPTLLLYLAALGSRVLELFLSDMDPIERAVLGGRLASAISGTVSVALVYGVARRLFSSGTAICAAAFIAFAPLHVTCSRYMKEDVLFTTMTLAAVLAALKGRQEGRSGWIALAGFFAGCSLGSKYTGALASLLVAAVCLLPFGSRRPRIPVLLFGAILVPIGFLLTTPYAVLDSESFLKHFSTERSHMRSGHQGIAIDAWSQWWMYHLSRSILPGIGAVATACALMAFGTFLRRPRAAGLFLLAAVALFYFPAEWVKAKPPPQPERYVLACVPFAAIAAAEFLNRLKESGHRRLAEILCVAAVVLPAYRSLTLTRDLAVDTRQEIREWLRANLPPDSKILIEAWYSPRLTEMPFRTKLLKASKHPQRFTRTRLKESGFDYLLVNSFSYGRYFTEPRYDRLMRARFQRVFESFPLVHQSSAPSGPYGFQNPDVRLYRIPRDASDSVTDVIPGVDEESADIEESESED